MLLNARKLMIVAVALFSTVSWAAPLSLWVGQTSFLGFPSRVSPGFAVGLVHERPEGRDMAETLTDACCVHGCTPE